MGDAKQKKPKKKLRHSKLVLPDEYIEAPSSKKEHQGGGRIQRATSQPVGTFLQDEEIHASIDEKPQAGEAAKQTFSSSDKHPKTHEREKKAANEAKQKKAALEVNEENLPKNAVLMPKQNPRVLEVRRKKRRRRVLSLCAVVLVAFGMWLYVSGSYLFVLMSLRDMADSAKVALLPGEGFPVEYSVPGYVSSEGMGSGGFASLGEKDIVMFSAMGEELQRIQHGFANPEISAGDTRVCVYSRGGTGYLVESRSETLLRQSTDDELLFVEMSDNGSLMVVTSSRYRSGVQIYNPLYPAEADLSWDIVYEKPVDGAFAQNNEDFALACLSSAEGALGTTVYLLNSEQVEMQATIRVDDTCILSMEYLSQSQLLVVYDRYAAVYNTRGEETARYDYGNRTLLTADVGAGRLALVFGSLGREDYDLVLLKDSMQAIFEVSTFGNGQAEVLSVDQGVYMLLDQQVTAYNLNGEVAQTKTFTEKPLELVQAREALLLTVSNVQSLDDLFAMEAVVEEESS